MKRRTSHPDRKADRSRLRIIAGRWRGRRLEFSAEPGLRPTPDRVRETLFNWLVNDVEGSRCLDLFAGSGALALEALSRGAAAVTALDISERALADLARNLARLQGTATLVCADACRWLELAHDERFDVVFIDPPFRSGLAERCIERLAGSPILAEGAVIYVETASDETAPRLPADWRLSREKFAGRVAYRLYRRTAAAAAD